jgi:putative acetyltransferase
MPTDTSYVIRDQMAADKRAVHELIVHAFKTMPFACGCEQFVMDALWETGGAVVALVAEDSGTLVGQAAFSKVIVAGRDVAWHGCGPVAVLPERQNRGIGSALMRAGLERLRALGSQGCVLVGHPNFYDRFGFRPTPQMFEPGVPPDVIMALPFGASTPTGEVTFAPAFQAASKTD